MSSAAVSGILGVILPPIIDFIRQKLGITHPKKAFWLAVLVSVVTGFAVDFSSGGLLIANGSVLDGTVLLANIGACFLSSQGVFKQYWEKSSARESFLG